MTTASTPKAGPKAAATVGPGVSLGAPTGLNIHDVNLYSGAANTRGITADSMNVALINKTMADQLWPNEDPIGKRIKFPGSEKNPQPWRTIVGIVNDVSQYALDQKAPMQIYLPHQQFPTSFDTIVVKTENSPEAMITTVRSAILAVDKEQAVYNVATLQDLLADSILLRTVLMLLMIVFATLALILAVVGIYGVMSYAVTQRTQEIGIRMALGASAADVLKLVLRNGMTLAVMGVLIGLAGAFALTRLLASLLFGVRPTDALTFAAVSGTVIGAALLACYIPARRATKLDPLTALRYE